MTDEKELFARRIRRDALAMIYHAKSGHPGGALSCADLISVLVKRELGWDGEQSLGHRFILSKGHACPALYAAAAGCGLVPRNELSGFRKLNRILQGHPHVKTTPWVETSTGSLGQGFSVAIGMAMGVRHQQRNSRIYAMLGDGELQEGEVWEGAMCAGHYGLDNLCAIIDYNKMQSDDLNENIMRLEPLADKWRAFNWYVIEINGHDSQLIESAFDEARQMKGKPTMIIAHTIKGKGVSFMEGSPLWHGSVKLRDEELISALRDLGAAESEIQDYLGGKAWE